MSRFLIIAKAFSWTAWALIFVWTAHKDMHLGWLILLCLLGTWLVVKLTYDFEEMSRRKEELEREFYRKKGEETFQKELEALQKVEQTEFAKILDAEWDKIRSNRGVRYSGETATPFTDQLGRPLSHPALQMLSVERMRLIVKLALEKPQDYKVFYEPLQVGNPYLAASLPSPDDIEHHKSAGNVSEFLKVWRGGVENASLQG